jgi:hypothetical protein
MQIPSSRAHAIYTGKYTYVQQRLVIVPKTVTSDDPKAAAQLKPLLNVHRVSGYRVSNGHDGDLLLKGQGTSLTLSPIN